MVCQWLKGLVCIGCDMKQSETDETDESDYLLQELQLDDSHAT